MKKLLFIAMLFACQLTFAQESIFIVDSMISVQNREVLKKSEVGAIIVADADKIKLYIGLTSKVFVYKYRYTSEGGKKLYSEDSETSELFHIFTAENLVVFHHIKSNIFTGYKFSTSQEYEYEK